jgi:hypothetical protein
MIVVYARPFAPGRGNIDLPKRLAADYESDQKILHKRLLRLRHTEYATPEPIKDWSLTGLKEKLIKIGAKIVSHGRYVAFQMAEVVIPKNLFADILRMIAELRPPPDPAPA